MKSASTTISFSKPVAIALLPEGGVEIEQAQAMQGASP